MIAPSTVARRTVQEIIATEFKDENVQVRSGFADASLGQYGPVASVSPVSEEPGVDDRLQLVTTLALEFFASWQPETDPDIPVDPEVIESYVYRLRLALAAYTQTPDSTIWWFQLDEVVYEPDPTGNITRFVASVTAHGNNPAG